jgi:predicted RNase H-related nuclease YkuK (DUF458 family)
MFTEEQLNDIFELLTEVNGNTKLYLGCDSIAYKRGVENGKRIWYGKFATVLVVHMNGNNGCRIFRHVDHERVYDTKKNRPADRLMKEVYRTSALYNQLIGLIDGFETEIHLDVNPNKEHGSSCVVSQATGYILGTTGINPDSVKLKPEAFAASFGADGIGRGYHERSSISFGKHTPLN